MAKIVYTCIRDIANAPLIKKRLESIIYKLVPDNIPDGRCKVKDSGQIIYGISTHSDTIQEKNNAVCMGMVYDSPGDWWIPGTKPPEGSYAIFRADEDHVEAITDIGCTRAIWYYKDDDIFIAGTSQRAVISIAGKFEFEKRNIPWMLSSGALAPSLSWCKNLHFVSPDSAVVLDRKTWKLTVKCEKPEFPIAEMTDREYHHEFKNLLLESFSEIGADMSKWILLISGGYDSRGIACLLKETGSEVSRVDTMTWGIQGSEKNKNCDGYIGGAVAKRLGMPHKFCATDKGREPVEKILERFITTSEGRTDHIGGYTDGMAIWKYIFDTGKHGIIRGDETFGGPHSDTFPRSRMLVGGKLCSDYTNLENYEQYGFEKQVVPDYFHRIPGLDTPGFYRDRLYQQYRMPFILSALSDIKYAYTEVMNPFLTRKIILKSRTLPDHLRDNKILCANIIDELSPRIPYATEQPSDLNEHILKTPAAQKLFVNEMRAGYMKDLFPPEFLTKVLTKLQEPSALSRKSILLRKLKGILGRNLPVGIVDKLKRKMPKPSLDIGVLAFRIYITGKMYKMLKEDVRRANEPQRQSSLAE